jgi:hypothetical protein
MRWVSDLGCGMRSAEATTTSTYDSVSHHLHMLTRADHSYLDRLAINEQTVEGGESLAGAVRLLERDVRDAATDATRSV